MHAFFCYFEKLSVVKNAHQYDISRNFYIIITSHTVYSEPDELFLR